jgi:hypothetical protein
LCKKIASAQIKVELVGTESEAADASASAKPVDLAVVGTGDDKAGDPDLKEVYSSPSHHVDPNPPITEASDHVDNLATSNLAIPEVAHANVSQHEDGVQGVGGVEGVDQPNPTSQSHNVPTPLPRNLNPGRSC